MNEIRSNEDLRLELRFKNARLWHAIYDKWGSISRFCSSLNCENRASSIGQLISLKKSPLQKRIMKPNPIAMWLCDVLEFDFGELFPPYLYEDRLPSLRVAEVYGEQILSLSDPEVKGLLVADIQHEENYSELKHKLEEVLKSLTPREEEVIRKRFLEGFEVAEIADIMGVSRERIKQIINKALRKLRHPARGSKIKEFWGKEMSPSARST